MKKISMIAAAAFLVGTLFTSCKKDYTCACTFNTTTGVTDDMLNFQTGKMSKKDAKAACEMAQTTWALFGASCELK